MVQLNSRAKRNVSAAKRKLKHRDANRRNRDSDCVTVKIANQAIHNNLQDLNAIIQELLTKIEIPCPLIKTKLDEAASVIESSIQLLVEAEKLIEGCTTLKSYANGIATSEIEAFKVHSINGGYPNLCDDAPHINTEIGSILQKKYSNHLVTGSLSVNNTNSDDTDSATSESPVDDANSTIIDVHEEEIIEPILIPAPVGKKYHSPFEACCFIDAAVSKRNSSKRIIRHLMREGYIKCSMTRMYQILKLFRQSGLAQDSLWAKKGRPKLVEKRKVVNDIMNNTRHSYGNTISQSDLKDVIRRLMVREWVARGYAAHSFQEPCNETFRNYEAQLKSHPAFNKFISVRYKKKNRDVAEWSQRAIVTYCLVVLSEHWKLIISPDPKYSKYQIRDSDMSAGALLGKKLVEEKNGHKMFHVLPGLATSTDDNSSFCFSGDSPGKESFYLVAREKYDGKPDSSKRCVYHTSTTNDLHKAGCRVSLTHTHSTKNHVATIFATITGLSAAEMPGPNDIETIAIEGLSPGSDSNPEITTLGYINCVRGKSRNDDDCNDIDGDEQESDLHNGLSKDARIAKLYRELVYRPFIASIRKREYGFEWDGVSEIPEELFAVSWQDGALGNMSALVSDDVLEEDDRQNIRNCKHNAARTALEQGCDIEPGFMVQKSSTSTTEPLDWLFFRIMQGLQERVPGLAAHKKKALAEFCAKLPIIYRDAYQPKNVEKGFLGNGQIDSKSKCVPDAIVMLDTYRGCIMDFIDPAGDADDRVEDVNEYGYNGGEMQKIETYLRETVFQFYNDVHIEGHVEEDRFLGQIPFDTDEKGNIVLKTATIRQEHWQRANCPSSKKRCEKRRALKEKTIRDRDDKEASRVQEEKKIYELADVCRRKLLNNIGEGANLPVELELKYFTPSPSQAEIKAFLKVRSGDKRTVYTTTGGPKYPGYSSLKVEELRQECINMWNAQVLIPHYSQNR